MVAVVARLALTAFVADDALPTSSPENRVAASVPVDGTKVSELELMAMGNVPETAETNVIYCGVANPLLFVIATFDALVASVAVVAFPVISPVKLPRKPEAVRIPVPGTKLNLVLLVRNAEFPGVAVAKVG